MVYLEHCLGPLDVEKNVREGPDGVCVPPHHHVRETKAAKVSLKDYEVLTL